MAIFPYLGLSLIPEPFTHLSGARGWSERGAGARGSRSPGEPHAGQPVHKGRWSQGFCCRGLKKAESLRLSLYKDVVTLLHLVTALWRWSLCQGSQRWAHGCLQPRRLLLLLRQCHGSGALSRRAAGAEPLPLGRAGTSCQWGVPRACARAAGMCPWACQALPPA